VLLVVQDYMEFVRRCVEWEPSARMTPEEALVHPWLAQRDSAASWRSTRVVVTDQQRYPRPAANPRQRARPASHGDQNDYS